MPTAPQHYNTIAKILHWLIGLAIIGMLALGWIMIKYPNSPEKYELFMWHKSVGITILMLAVLRLVWRLFKPVPELPADLPNWQKAAANTAYALLYLLMIAIPFSGWLLNSASPFKITLYGLFVWPNLPFIGELSDDMKHQIKEGAANAHNVMTLIIAALVLVHAGAAMQHHFIRRDDVLLRMSPRFLHRLLDKIRGK